MSERELTTSVYDLFSACKNCPVAQEMIGKLSSKTSIAGFSVEVKEIHLKCRVEPYSRVYMGGRTVQMVNISDGQKTLHSRLDAELVRCPQVNG